MNAQPEPTLFRRISARIVAAPWILLAYTFFAAAVSFADLLLRPLTSESFRSQLVPYTGWSASGFYSFTLFFACLLIYQRSARTSVRFGIAIQLLLSIAFGSLHFFRSSTETFGNPYLTVSPWRPVWTMLIPCVWLAALYSPRMNHYCRRQDGPLLG